MRPWERGVFALEIVRGEPPTNEAYLALRLRVDDEDVAFSGVTIGSRDGVPNIQSIRPVMDRFLASVRAIKDPEFVAEVTRVLQGLPDLVSGPDAIGNLPGDLPSPIGAIGPGETVPDGYELTETTTNPFTGEEIRRRRRPGALRRPRGHHPGAPRVRAAPAALGRARPRLAIPAERRPVTFCRVARSTS